MISKNYKSDPFSVINKNIVNYRQSQKSTQTQMQTSSKRHQLQIIKQKNYSFHQQLIRKREYTAEQPLLNKKEKNRLEQLKRKYANNKGKQNNQILSIKIEKYQNQKAQLLEKQKKQQKQQQQRSAQNYQFLFKKANLSEQNKEQYRPNKIFFQQQSQLKIHRNSRIQAKEQNKISIKKNKRDQNQYFQEDQGNNSVKLPQFLLKNQLDQFKGKVLKVNSNIQFKLDYLQSKLNQLRFQKRNQNQCFYEKQKQKSSKKQLQKQNFISPYKEQKVDFVCSSPKIKVQRSKLAQYATQLAESEIIQLQTKNELRQNEFISQKRQNLKQQKFSDQINEININQHQQDIIQTKLKIDVLQLKGKFKRKVSKDFTTFINRLSHQIQIDTEFTAKLANYNNIQVLQEKQTKYLLKIIREKVKSMTSHYPIAYHDEILQINQMQIDPLQNFTKPQIKRVSSQQILSLAMKIRDEYIKVQEFFYRKLHKKFKTQVIDILIEELKQIYSIPQNEINIGHLTSYLNMRTGSEFRNRNFFKLLKRLKTQENILKIDKRVLKQLFLAKTIN